MRVAFERANTLWYLQRLQKLDHTNYHPLDDGSWRALLTDGVVYILSLNGIPAGCVAGAVEKDGLRVYSASILPQFRNLRLSYRLIGKMLDVAREKDCDRLVIDVAEYACRADMPEHHVSHILQKLGFLATGKINSESHSLNGEQWDSFEFAMRVR